MPAVMLFFFTAYFTRCVQTTDAVVSVAGTATYATRAPHPTYGFGQYVIPVFCVRRPVMSARRSAGSAGLSIVRSPPPERKKKKMRSCGDSRSRPSVRPALLRHAAARRAQRLAADRLRCPDSCRHLGSRDTVVTPRRSGQRGENLLSSGASVGVRVDRLPLVCDTSFLFLALNARRALLRRPSRDARGKLPY